jgi:hypothetical protein
MALAIFVGSLAGNRPEAPSSPELLHTIKMGVAFGVEAGLGFKPDVTVEKSHSFPPANVQADEHLPFVTFRKWYEFTERQQEIYTQALLETWSFILYGMTDKQKSPSDFSAFTTCVETEQSPKFIQVIDMRYSLRGNVSTPIVGQLFDVTPLICDVQSPQAPPPEAFPSGGPPLPRPAVRVRPQCKQRCVLPSLALVRVGVATTPREGWPPVGSGGGLREMRS